MNCRICNSKSGHLFNTKVLNRYDVDYFQCPSCRFVQTEKPYWLEEAYATAITNLDIGLLSRNSSYANVLEALFYRDIFNQSGKFLDYGGGYGVFVRMMRDKGFDFYRQDIYCKNLFARHFDVSDLPDGQRFDLVTAFEVFEHLEEPSIELRKMLKLSDTILFSTLLQPDGDLTPQNWWYFIPETGQHLSLYSIDSLKKLASINNLRLYTNGSELHILTRRDLVANPFEAKHPKKGFVQKVKGKLFSNRDVKPVKSRESLLQKDFDRIRSNSLR